MCLLFSLPNHCVRRARMVGGAEGRRGESNWIGWQKKLVRGEVGDAADVVVEMRRRLKWLKLRCCCCAILCDSRNV